MPLCVAAHFAILPLQAVWVVPMRRIIINGEPPEGFLEGNREAHLSAHEILQIYNGLDCALTSEVLDNLKPQLDEETCRVYRFEKALQEPVLFMQKIGLRIDREEQKEALARLQVKIDTYSDWLNRLALVVWGDYLNANSPQQLKDFFYGSMDLPTIYAWKNNKKRATTDKNALELLWKYVPARPIITLIRAIKTARDEYAVIGYGVDEDGRMRTTYNITGTITGRWSSSKSAFGTGKNLQNITEHLRKVFIPDEGMKLASFDLAQSESRIVGAILWKLFKDDRYLNACESGDIHTAVARDCFPDVQWQGDIVEDRKLAEMREGYAMSYRDMSKRVGHATNYAGSAKEVSAVVGVNMQDVVVFQRKYYDAYPLQRWHQWVESEIQSKRILTTFVGRRRQFFSRTSDKKTIKEGIAFEPQSASVDICNIGLYRLWKHMRNEVQLLQQGHDSVLLQFPEEREAEILPRAKKLLEIHFDIEGRDFYVPVECKTGHNWMEASEANPRGLKSVELE